MPASIAWEGLEELKAMLRALPEDLTDEAKGIVQDAAEAAKADIYAAYPARTGSLRNGLKISSLDLAPWVVNGKTLGTGALLYNNAPHAFIFEHGTVARHNGIRATGIMPPGHVFIPRVITHRRAMYADLARMLEAHGLLVTSHAA